MYLGSVTGLAFCPILIHKFGWPSVFYSFGFGGSIWFALWLKKGIPLIADSGKKKILLLKGKKPETTCNRIPLSAIPEHKLFYLLGSHRNYGRRGTAHSTKDDSSQNVSEGKSSKRGATAHVTPEKQVWVQKSSLGS